MQGKRGMEGGGYSSWRRTRVRPRMQGNIIEGEVGETAWNIGMQEVGATLSTAGNFRAQIRKKSGNT